MLASGTPVNVVGAIAGHSTPTVTLNVYSHIIEGGTRAAVNVLDAALAGGR
jgi:hypothetical protein